jgi:hypothetical protein
MNSSKFLRQITIISLHPTKANQFQGILIRHSQGLFCAEIHSSQVSMVQPIRAHSINTRRDDSAIIGPLSKSRSRVHARRMAHSRGGERCQNCTAAAPVARRSNLIMYSARSPKKEAAVDFSCGFEQTKRPRCDKCVYIF